MYNILLNFQLVDLLIGALEEVQAHKVDIISKLLNLDDVGKRDPVRLTLRQFLLPVEVARCIILLVQLPLIQVVVLKKDLTYRKVTRLVGS